MPPLSSLWQLYTMVDTGKLSLCQETDTIFHVIFLELLSISQGCRRNEDSLKSLILILTKQHMLLKKVIETHRQNCVNHFKSSPHSLNSLNTALCNEVSQIQRNKTVFKFYSGLFLTPDFFFLRKGTEFGIKLVVSRKLLFQLSLLELILSKV